MAKNTLTFLVTLTILVVAVAYLRTIFGAEVGEPCNDFILSCRATRGILTVNACAHTGSTEADSFCTYACTSTAECPEDWACEAAATWSSVPGAAEDVDRVCRRPH